MKGTTTAKETVKESFTSWRTTIFGLAGVLGAALMQVWHDNPDIVRIGQFMASFGAAAGLMFARDHRVTDEESGATERYLKKAFAPEEK